MTQLLIALALVTFSIFIHELGHFLVARWRGLYVPRFSIFGIGKPIISKRWRGVDYCICWLPIGAYVMVPQLSDMGDFEGELPPEARGLPPADYKSKVLVAIAGPAANILFAILLASVVWMMGIDVLPENSRTEIGDVARELSTTGGKTVPGPGFAAGLQTGDLILEVDGKPVTEFQDVWWGVMRGSEVASDGRRVTTLTIQRNKERLTKQVFPELVSREGLRSIGIGPRHELLVIETTPDSPAKKAGILSGDRILAVDGKPLSRREELAAHLQKKFAEPSVLTLQRGEQELNISVQPQLMNLRGQSRYAIGVGWTVHIHQDPFTQLAASCRQIYQTLSSLIDPRSDIRVQHMSGMVGIVDGLQQAASAGIVPTFAFLLAINLSLAIFNLLPIPVLDGGHVVIATWTKLRGQPPSALWLQKAVAACFVMLVGLIIYVTFHDIRRKVQESFDDDAPAATAKPSDKDAKDAKAPAVPAPAK